MKHDQNLTVASLSVPSLSLNSFISYHGSIINNIIRRNGVMKEPSLRKKEIKNGFYVVSNMFHQ